MKLAIDMNLTPQWVEYFRVHGIEAQHWSDLGDPKAPDREIMLYARERGLVVFTHDLDFGNILAVTHALGPSVIQVRTQDPVPQVVGNLVLAAINAHRSLLERGALVTIEPDKRRVRVLPIILSIALAKSSASVACRIVPAIAHGSTALDPNPLQCVGGMGFQRCCVVQEIGDGAQ